MVSSGLSVLPRDCVEEIMNHLDLSTLKALRLSSRTLCAQCTGPRFRQFLRSHSVELTKSSLHSLRELLVHPELGTAVKNLEIVATIYDQTPHMQTVEGWKKSRKGHKSASGPNEETVSQAKDNLAWLRTQQQRQDEVSYDMAVDELVFCLRRVGNLDNIELDAVLVQGPNTAVTADTGDTNWYPVWMRASRTFCITMEAITMSGVELKTLTVYQRTPRCSVPLYDIATNLEMLDSGKLRNAGKSIEQLSLSISNKVATGATERPPQDPVACHEVAWYGERPAVPAYVASFGEVLSGENEKFDGLARFLRLTPSLKALEIHFYNTTLKPYVGSHSMFEAVENEIRLPLLRRCSIGGITTSENSLIHFLCNHPQITDLTLSYITLLPEGSWDSIFALLGQRMPSLERLHLSTLISSDRRRVNLHPVWDDCPRELEENRPLGIYFVHTKVFNADDIRKGLEFRPMPFAAYQGSPHVERYLRSVRTHYGSPWESKRVVSRGQITR
ncbi:hypothetical protein BDW62DRAFT_107792 [Aspergillus aurantiobrunneus]